MIGDDIENRLDQMEDLLCVIGGSINRLEALVMQGKQSKVLETVPEWRESECNSRCDYTEVAMPKGKRVKAPNNRLYVHPGVVAWAEANKIEDIENEDPDEVPKDYLVTPFVTRIRDRYQPVNKLQWEPDQLLTMDRHAAAAVAADMKVADICKTVHEGIDWRFESKEWLIQTLRLIRKVSAYTLSSEDVAKAVAPKLKFESDKNLETLESGVKKATGGSSPKKKVASKKKVSKKKTAKKAAKKKTAKKGKSK